VVFLCAVRDEAEDARQLLRELERAWFTARGAVAGRRRDSSAAAAVDLLAAVPLLSATSLASHLDLATKNTLRLLDGLCADGVVVEVTQRAKRRLFGLAGMTPLITAVQPPRRRGMGQGRGLGSPEMAASSEPIPNLPPLSPLERRTFDYGDLDAALAELDETVRRTRRTLDMLARANPMQPAAAPAPG
jgi:hypothetical protein